MRDVPAAGGAVVLAVSLPFVVAIATGAGAMNKAAKPDPAKVVVRHTAGIGFGDVHSFVVAIRAKGPAPSSATLRNDTGLNVARVQSAAGRCEGKPVRELNIEGADTVWCLEVRGATAGSVLEGTLPASGGGPAVQVQVSTKHALLLGPIAVLLFATTVAVGAAIVPGLLVAANTTAAITRLLRLNASRPPSERVVGLEALEKGLQASKPKASDRLAIISPLVHYGPGVAASKRTSLAEFLRDTAASLPPGHPAMTAARGEASRTDHKVQDFVASDGSVHAHPAEKWAAVIKDLGPRYERVTAFRTRAIGLPEADEIHGMLDALEGQLGEVRDPDVKVNQFDDALNKIAGELGKRGRRVLTAAATSLAPTSAATTIADYLGARPELALLTTLGVLGLIVVASITSTVINVWLPAATFGTLADYAKLGATGMATGAATSIVALLAPWFGLTTEGKKG